MEGKPKAARIVTTRVQPPAGDGRLVTRDRLADLLQAGRRRLALIHAPAGFGKTTLALQWQRKLRAQGVPVAWISIDRDDNDGLVFLGKLVDSVRRVAPTLGGESLGDLLEQQSGDTRGYVLTALVNQFVEYRQPIAIVIDDWHLIEHPETAAALDFLLDVGPGNLHLIVTSRTRAPSIAKLKVRNEVMEIDAAQLRFNYDESAAFLLDLNALDLSVEDVQRLWASTDGWVAALQLAALSLRTTNNASALINGFSGRHHSIGDYLTENVLNGLPGELLEFLLTTSICDRLCGDLAAAVSGQARGQAILEELERRNMFLHPLDDHREWFRYHHLFGGYLRQRLERDYPERIVTLHRIAAAWFADLGMLSEAVTHALAAGDDEGAVDLVERQAMGLVEHSRMASLLGLVNKLPQHLLPGRPALQIAIGWANCLLQRVEDSRIALDHVRTALGSAPDGNGAEIIGEADVVQACTDVYRDRIDRAADLVAPCLVENSGCRPFLVAVSANIRTFVDIHSFAYEMAQSRQQWANAFHETANGPFAGVYGRCFAGLAAFAQLDLHTAERRYAEARALAQRVAGEHSHAARLAGALVGRICYERNDIDTAEVLLEECHELGAESGVPDFMIATYRKLARIRILRGDIDGALSLLDEGAEAARQFSLPRLSAAVDHERVRLYLAVGDLGRAQNVLARQAVTSSASGGNGIEMATRHYQLGVEVQLRCAHRDYDGARELLSGMQRESRSLGWRYAEISSTIALAKALSLAGDTNGAARALVPALAVGARCGLIRTVVDAGPDLLNMVSELREAIRTGRSAAGLPQVPAEYLSTLLTTAHADARKAAIPVIGRAAERRPLPEGPLNARETQILRLLDRGLSNKQIARYLGLTVNTVKWYLKNLYIKLGVARRGEAISEARRRRILP